MAEEGQGTAPETGTTETPSYFGEDGNFVENWTHLLKDESLHDDPTLKTIKSMDLFAANHVLQRKKIGNTVLIPNEASSETEWDEWHKAGGRPDTAGDYAFARPEELPEEYYNQEFATAAQELFHKLGISKKQADALFAFNNNAVIAQLAKNAQDAELETTTLKDGLYADWGNAYEQKKHMGNVAIEQGTSDDVEFKGRIVEKFGNDPDFIRFAANLGGKFAESSSIKVDTIPTPADIQVRIDEAMANKAYGLDFAQHGFTKAQHKAQVEKVAVLFREKTKHVKTG